MEIERQVVVFDSADLASESAFWAGVLGGLVIPDDDDGWHSVLDAHGQWRMGIQLAPNHMSPDWPNGQQQVHLDLHVSGSEAASAAHEELVALGASLLQDAKDLEAGEGHRIYASPAGHPFCIGWHG
jgi:hypothetical protein